jgi:hypothetical protein
MEKNLIPAPIDNKNLMEDPFEDEVFADFFAARDHRESGNRHLIGIVDVYDEEFPKCVNYSGYVDVSWSYGFNTVTIKVIAVSGSEDFEETRDAIHEHYKKLFNSWVCDDNPGLIVRYGSENDSLYVHFYFDTTKC